MKQLFELTRARDLTLFAVCIGVSLAGHSFAQYLPDASGRFIGDELIVGTVNGAIPPVKLLADGIGGKIIDQSLNDDWVLIKLKPTMSVAKATECFRGKPGVRYVEPNGIARNSYTPNDPYYWLQWAIPATRLDRVWDVERAHRGIVVAVLDTGISLDHPEFEGRILRGYNYIHGNNDIRDLHGHGTKVAGVIGARSDNGVGIAGASPLVTILVNKVLGDDGWGTNAAIANGIHDCVNRGAGVVDVINMSLGGPEPSQALLDACNRAWSNGILLVASAGNENSSNEHYPAAYGVCLAVAATDLKDRRASFSNFGPWVDLAAPGVDIWTLRLDGGYEARNGTSYPATLVSGTAALLFHQNPFRSAADVRATLISQVDNYGQYDGPYGRLNALKAFKASAMLWPVYTQHASLGSWGRPSSHTCYISEDSLDIHGRFVVFTTRSSYFDYDDNDDYDIFLRDLQLRNTLTLSRAPGGEAGNGSSTEPMITSNARYVSFGSSATNLVQDTNGFFDGFLYDVWASTLRLVTLGTNQQQGNNESGGTVVSEDGRYVAFDSLASNFDPLDRNGLHDVYWRDLNTGVTRRVTKEFFTGEMANGVSRGARISADGRFVSFWSQASNLVVADTNSAQDIFVWDSHTDLIKRVSVSSNGTQGNHYSYNPAISATGRFIAFDSAASNLVGGDTQGYSDVFRYDQETGATERVSLNHASEPPNHDCLRPSISDDGRYVSFVARASNMHPRDVNGHLDVFVRDLTSSRTIWVSVPAGGGVANNESFLASLSGNGKSVAMSSKATNMVAEDLNDVHDIFVRFNYLPIEGASPSDN